MEEITHYENTANDDYKPTDKRGEPIGDYDHPQINYGEPTKFVKKVVDMAINTDEVIDQINFLFGEGVAEVRVYLTSRGALFRAMELFKKHVMNIDYDPNIEQYCITIDNLNWDGEYD